ncbi:MAG: hypothetical protein WC922_07340 [Synergistaceae bacterium]|jgi:hypothetical protein
MDSQSKDFALPCGCIIGEYHCDEAVKLALDAAHAFRGCQNAPASDYGWKRYEDAQLAYYDHISKGVKHELTEETV